MEEQGWAPTLAAVRERRRRFENGEVLEGPDADTTDGSRHRVLVAAVVASAFTALWVGGVVGLVTPPAEALGTDPYHVGLFPRAAAIWILLVTAVIAGCLAAVLSPVPIERRRGAVTAALLITLATLAVTLKRMFPFQVPIGEHVVSGNRAYLETGPEVLARFLPVVAAGALSTVFVALVLVRDPRPRSRLAVAAMGIAWVIAGSGVTRPPWLTERASRTGTDVFGHPDLSIAMLGGGVLLVTLALVQVLRMPVRREGRAFSRRWIVVAEVASVTGAVLTLVWPTHHVGSWVAGRPLRRRRRQLLPPIQLAGGGTIDAGVRWVRCAAEEKASIRAFEDVAAQLTRLRAPRALVDRGLAAARDEEHHTEACLAVAALLGQRGSVGEVARARPLVTRIPTALRSAHLQLLVRESIVDGMIGEALAAERLHVGGAHATSSAIRSILARLAADERAHAELATDIVRWCSRVDPRGTRRQIRWALKRMPGDGHDAERHGHLAADRNERAGLVDPAQGQQCWRTVRRRVLQDLATIEQELASAV